jgi:probable F420-dependent oxidoreductase
MKLGVTLPNFGPAATADSLRAWAAVVEDAGFDFLMVGDHVAATPDVTAAYPGPFWEPLTLLGYLAGVTRRVELGTTVLVVPYREPLLTARSLAGLDQLSGGRLVVGVGVGWAGAEFAALGLDARHRGEITDEYLRALLALWSDDVVSFAGRHVAFTDVDTRPRPHRAPHPPLWIGGNGAAARRRAVRFGQAWHPLRVRAGWLRTTGLPALRVAADQEGRPVPALAPRVVLHPTAEPRPDDGRLVGEGTPEQIRADLDELRELGATHVLLDTHRDAASAAHDDHGALRALVEDAAGWLAPS